MKKWMVLVFGGVMTMTEHGAATPVEAVRTLPAAVMVLDTDPCPSCCPISICGVNGPSLDGTTQAAEHPTR
jgi:hypothetical protein